MPALTALKGLISHFVAKKDTISIDRLKISLKSTGSNCSKTGELYPTDKMYAAILWLAIYPPGHVIHSLNKPGQKRLLYFASWTSVRRVKFQSKVENELAIKCTASDQIPFLSHGVVVHQCHDTHIVLSENWNDYYQPSKDRIISYSVITYFEKIIDKTCLCVY